MIPFTEVGIMDRNSEYRGVPPGVLMENAGKALAEELLSRYPGEKFLFLCGTGNNGGDGYVAARYMGKERASVFLAKGRDGVNSPLAQENLDKVDCNIVEVPDMSRYVIVDCLLGTGISGTVREPYRSLIQEINQGKAPVVSIDVPSGLGGDVTVQPDVTITFHDIKEGMTPENSGEMIVKDIGVPDKAVEYTGPGETLLYPYPSKSSHKGENGRVLIIGGGPYTGAPALAAQGAYRTGVDLVHLAVPSRIALTVAGFDPHFVVRPLKGDVLSSAHVERLVEMAEDFHAVVMGPGLGRDEATIEALGRLMEDITIPKVIDADALLAVRGSAIAGEAVLTPHEEEFKTITGKEASKEAADTLAEEMEVTVLLKGEVDYITDGKRYKFNDFGTPAMTVGGTGDILAGVVGALLAKGLNPFDAARLGVYMTCRAGEMAFEDHGWGVLPGDIKEYISRTMG